jgi:hypothetical protein
MPPLNTGNHEIEVSFHFDNKHEERDDGRPSRTWSNADIRNELCRLQLRCEDLEQDRNYYAVKANELQETLEAYSFDDIQETLLKKTMRIAEASMNVDRLHLHIRKVEAKINRMKTERETERVNMMDLSGIVRSLRSSLQDSDEEEEDEVLPTLDKAQDITLKNMKFQIEFLEDERQKMALKCMDQASAIEVLKKDSEVKKVRIRIFEELFRSVNSEERSSCQAHETTAVVTKPALEKTKSESRLVTSKNKIISFCRSDRLQKMNSVPVLTASGKAEELLSLKGTSIDPNNARQMEIKVGDLEGQYNGPLRNSLPHGTGTIRFRDGDTYLGELVDGEMHGNGTLYHRSKDLGISRGYFQHNLFVGMEKEGPLRKRR